jgi:lipopolysaccharide transport system permease protein
MHNKEVIIEAGRTESQYWKDLWRYRELFYFLAWRDILVRYKQTVIGIAWALMTWYNFVPSWRILTLPVFVLIAFTASMGVGLWLSALNVKYRDFRYLVPFLVQFGLYISPVGFSSSIVPVRWRLLYSLNPMVCVIDRFRWAILRGESILYWPGFTLSVGLVALLFASGVWYFRKTERTFADVI